MTEYEDYPIPVPYSRTEEDYDCIASASPNRNYHKDDWDKDCLAQFKLRLKKYLRPLQNRRCAYCRCVIHRNEAQDEIEHIIPKHAKPQWMYTPMNLCLSCKSCNTKKHTKSVYALPHAQVHDFPTVSEDYKIIHPYLDRYSEHIELIDEILYRGISKKGRETIRMCKLDRYELAATRAEEVIRNDANKNNRYLQILLNLNDPNRNMLVDDVGELIQELNISDVVMSFRNQG